MSSCCSWSMMRRGSPSSSSHAAAGGHRHSVALALQFPLCWLTALPPYPSFRSCQVSALLLRSLDIPCVPLHSILSQAERLAALAKFRAGRVRVLVATDVASRFGWGLRHVACVRCVSVCNLYSSLYYHHCCRGLDIPAVDVVVNSNVPASAKDYIHRVGRTARAG